MSLDDNTLFVICWKQFFHIKLLNSSYPHTAVGAQLLVNVKSSVRRWIVCLKDTCLRASKHFLHPLIPSWLMRRYVHLLCITKNCCRKCNFHLLSIIAYNLLGIIYAYETIKITFGKTAITKIPCLKKLHLILSLAADFQLSHYSAHFCVSGSSAVSMDTVLYPL